jgi:glycine/serine hydroxymethyltransferase
MAATILYAAPHTQLYDLLARWVHHGGLTARGSAIHDSQHLVLLSIAMLMQQEAIDATASHHEPLETKLHVALLGESSESRAVYVATLRRIVNEAVAFWDSANPAAGAWHQDHLRWCESLRAVSMVDYPNLLTPDFYLHHLRQAVAICQVRRQSSSSFRASAH